MKWTKYGGITVSVTKRLKALKAERVRSKKQ